MADKNSDKRCPLCSGQIDYFGSCRRCGREWSEGLEVGEKAFGLPEGEQHKSIIKQVGKRPPRKSRFTKSKEALAGKEFKTFAPEVPQKYQIWQIDADWDDDTEIIRKRSLMRLDSNRIYSALGLTIRARDSQKAALLWLSRVWEFLEEDEQKALAPTVEHLKRSFAEIREFMQSKVAETAEMEKALEKAHKAARKARLRIAADEQKKRAAEKIIVPGEDTEGFSVPEPVGIPPADLLERAKEKLLALEEEKALRKKVDTDIFDE